jgi:hypothetical protein
VRRASVRTVWLAIALGSCAFSRTGWAQSSASAEALFDKGMERLKENDFEAACPLFEESRRLDPKPGVLFTLAACEAKRGRIATALTLYEDYLEIVSSLPPAQRSRQQAREKVARKERESLKPNIPMLTVVMPASAPSKLVVKRDGEAMGKPSLGVALPVDPGEHVVTVHGDNDKTLLTERVTLKQKEQRTVQLPAVYPDAEGEHVDQPPPPPPPPARKIPIAVPIAALGLGGLGIGLGAVFGALAFERKSVVNSECTGTVCRSEEGKSAGETGHTFATISTVSFIVGSVAAAAGITILLVDGGDSPPPQTGAARLSVEPGVMLGAGRAGGVVRGRF